MAEKSSELKNLDRVDPITASVGAGTGVSLEQYGSDFESTDSKRREMIQNTDEHPDETQHIRSQIEETRKEMGETIDAIQERFSFANMSDQVSEQVSNVIESAKDTIYDATIGKAVKFMRTTGDGIANSTVIRTARDNPLPLLLIGLGAGLLAYQSYGRGRSTNLLQRKYLGTGDQENWERRDEGSAGTLRTTGKSYTGRAYDTVAGAASGAYEGVAGAASGAVDRVTNVADRAYQGVTSTVSSVRTSAGDLANRAYDSVGEYGTKAYETYDYYLDENPLAVAAVAAALGAAVGFAIPASRFEGRVMGEARENVLNRVQGAAGELVDRAKQVAAETGQTIKDEANKALNQ